MSGTNRCSRRWRTVHRGCRPRWNSAAGAARAPRPRPQRVLAQPSCPPRSSRSPPPSTLLARATAPCHLRLPLRCTPVDKIIRLVALRCLPLLLQVPQVCTQYPANAPTTRALKLIGDLLTQCEDLDLLVESPGLCITKTAKLFDGIFKWFILYFVIVLFCTKLFFKNY